ncbi:DUF87 domain-containing protein [Halobaculum sp. CBA1158]|uniref:VirB4 family type IV secretion system protein n=1 Tax=Halobaculum sp. CBA1158 TaxID=2904243 RepID=UPI001F2AB458|nr:DUF87 domain-containing protein [Halobaculum sp. CBA1158]UIO99750.1 DUF87 domain-containing protein [Halobaculum sp. CBA1158]
MTGLGIAVPALALEGPLALAGALVLVAGIADYIPGLSGGGESEAAGEADDDDDFEDLDQALLDEAARRLDRRGEEVTGANLWEVIEEIRSEAASEKPSRAVRSPETQGDAQRVAVAPDKVEEHESHIVRRGENGEEKYVRQLIVSSFPSRVSYGWLDQLFAGDTNIRISYHTWPRDPDSMLRKLNIRNTRLRGQIRDKREKGNINTTEEEQQLEEIERLREQVTRGNTSLFDFALYIEVIADDEEDLDERTARVRQVFAQSNARVTPLYDRQLDGQASVAPLGRDKVRNTQVMDTNALGTTFPFIEPSVVQPSGVLLGFHDVTGTPVVVDRFDLSGHNMLISGKIGSGKSYLAKLAVWRRLQMDPDTDVLIIDPVGGMSDLVDAIGGQRVQVGGSSVINPLELQDSDVDEADEELDLNPYEQKIRSVMGLFHTHFEGRRELTKEEEGILRRAVRLAYLRHGITPDVSTHHNDSPTVQTVLDVLRAFADGNSPSEFMDVPPEHEPFIESIEMAEGSEAGQKVADHAHNVLLGLEDFQEGGQNQNLNGESNVQLHDRVVQFDLSQARTQGGTPLMMHVVLDWLFQRARANDGKTLVVIDEAHYMLGQEEPLRMLELFARHSRHYDSGMTLISQTVDEFMKNESAKAIYDQCDIRALMRHENIGDEALEALDLTDRERRYVIQAQAGNSANYSQSLLYVTDVGKIRLKVLSNGYEHSVIETAENPWAYLYDQGLIDWDYIPEAERPGVRAELQG